MNGSSAGERRERKDMRRNLERVLQAAHELFAERGSEVTMEEVARRAGVGVGTVYRRFRNKDHLFAEVSHVACADAHHCLVVAAENERDVVGKLRALVLAQYHRCEHQAALLDVRGGVEAHSCTTFVEQQQLYRSMHEMLEQIILEGQQQGLIRPGNAALMAAFCLELLKPQAFQNLARLLDDAEELAEQTVWFVLHGLAAGR